MLVGVRAGLRLGEREAGELAAGREVGQEALLLLVGAEHVDALEADRLVDAEDDRERRVDLGEGLEHARVAGLREALAAVALVDVEAAEPGLAERAGSSSSPIQRFSSISRWSMRAPISRAAAFSVRIRSCSSGSGAGHGKTSSSWISPRNSDFANEETARSGLPSTCCGGRRLHGPQAIQARPPSRASARAAPGDRPTGRRGRRGPRDRTRASARGRRPCSSRPRACRSKPGSAPSVAATSAAEVGDVRVDPLLDRDQALAQLLVLGGRRPRASPRP